MSLLDSLRQSKDLLDSPIKSENDNCRGTGMTVLNKLIEIKFYKVSPRAFLKSADSSLFIVRTIFIALSSV